MSSIRRNNDRFLKPTEGKLLHTPDMPWKPCRVLMSQHHLESQLEIGGRGKALQQADLQGALGSKLQNYH